MGMSKNQDFPWGIFPWRPVTFTLRRRGLKPGPTTSFLVGLGIPRHAGRPVWRMGCGVAGRAFLKRLWLQTIKQKKTHQPDPNGEMIQFDVYEIFKWVVQPPTRGAGIVFRILLEEKGLVGFCFCFYKMDALETKDCSV